MKRQAMKKKYGSNFPGKELMLFHGTSYENVEKINSGGLNRSFAGKNGNVCSNVLRNPLAFFVVNVDVVTDLY